MRRRRKPLPAPRRDAGGRSRASSAVESVLGFGGGVLIARAPRRTDPDARRSDTSFQTTRSIARTREGVRKSSGLPVGARLVRGSRIGRRGSRAARPAHPRARAGRQPRERSRTDRPSSISSTPRPRWRRRERSTSRSASPRRAGAGASAASRPGAKARSLPRPRWRPRPGPAARTPSRYAPPSFPHHSIARVDRPSAVATDEARTRAVVPETAARPPFKTATLARARHRGSGALELRLARLPVRASARPHATPPLHTPSS